MKKRSGAHVAPPSHQILSIPTPEYNNLFEEQNFELGTSIETIGSFWTPSFLGVNNIKDVFDLSSLLEVGIKSKIVHCFV